MPPSITCRPVEIRQRLEHGHDILPRHAGAGAAADGKNNALAARTFEHVERGLFHFVGRSAHRDFERVHIAHETHAVAYAPLHFPDILLLAPIEHVEAGVGQVIEARIDFGVVVIDLHPVLREGVADSLQIRMRELHVMLFVDEADDVVENEDALDFVAHHFVLRLEPIDDDARAEIDQAVRAFRVLHQIDHEMGRAANKSGGAERTARGDHRQNVAMVEDALPLHADAMQRKRREGVGLHFVFGKLVDVFQAVERVVFAGRVVLPELDLGAEDRWLGRHAVFHPPGRNEDDVGKFAHDLQVRLEPDLRVEKVVQVLDAEIAGHPRAVDDQRHRDLVQLFQPGGALKNFPLFG